MNLNYRRGLSLIEILLVISILGILLGLLLPAIGKIRDRANRAACTNNLRQIGLALHGHHQVYGHLPAGTRSGKNTEPFPYMGWTCQILPWIEQGELFEEARANFRRSDDFSDNHHHKTRTTVIPTYLCPIEPVKIVNYQSIECAITSYIGVGGNTTSDGVLFYDSKVSFAEITDGLSYTLAVGERPPDPEGQVSWWYAGVGLWDGSTEGWLRIRQTNFSYRHPMCHRGPFEYQKGRRDNKCDVFHFWSEHLNGANFLAADGAVHFIPYRAANLLPALATRAGNEVADWDD